MENNIRMSDISSAEEFLEHHGILGQKWGKKHGPPYPLDSDVSTGKSLRVENRAKKKKEKAKAKRSKAAAKRMKEYNKNKKALEKWKKKIAKDPEKLAKNADKFTTEEINAAIEKFQNRDRVASYRKAPEKLSMVKRHLAKDEKTLYKNRNEFTPEEMELALQKIYKDQAAQRAKNESDRLKRDDVIDKLRVTNQILNTVGNAAETANSVIRTGTNWQNYKTSKLALKTAKRRDRIGSMSDLLERKELDYQMKNFDADKKRYERSLERKERGEELDLRDKLYKSKKSKADAISAFNKERRERDKHSSEMIDAERRRTFNLNDERRKQESHEVDLAVKWKEDKRKEQSHDRYESFLNDMASRYNTDAFSIYDERYFDRTDFFQDRNKSRKKG